MKNLVFALLTIASLLFAASCKKGDDKPATKDLTLNLTGLEDLGSDYVYEGWLIVDGAAVSSGRFSVNSSGALSQTMFPVNSEQLDKATRFVLTIEPATDPDPGPSAVHILGGNFSGDQATVTVDDQIADFSGVAGTYILATPTNGPSTDENSGIWFLDPSSGSPMQGLTLPMLPTGWKYEGWAVINGMPVTSGKFTMAKQSDEFNGFSGSMPLMDVNGSDGFFPGEDYLMNAPSGLTFPTDLAGGKAVISVEPDPDNSPAPFTLKPLVGDIPAGATDHTPYQMGQNLSFPTGTVSR